MEAPAQLASLRQWILWRYEGEGNSIKMPRQLNGRKAKTNDKDTWNDLSSLQGKGQLGFVFVADGGLFGIDLDGCLGSDGELAEWADAIIKRLPTYAEVSPSGTGIKIYGKGTLPSGIGKKRKINSPAVCDKLPAVEAYDRGRYFAFTGDHLAGTPLEVCDCQEQVSQLCSELWPAKKAESAQPRQTRNSSDLVLRAEKYLSRMPGAVSKQGGHNQTFRVACVLVLGFGLSIEDAFPLFANWNATCDPPWEDKDLWHKLADANKREGERGWLLESRGYEGTDIDLRALLDCVEQDGDDSPAFNQIENIQFPVDCLTVDGLIGDVMAYNLRTARYPQPELAMAGAIALMATITGRKVTDAGGTRTNVYVLGLAPSGAGKEHARKLNKELLMQAGGDCHIGPERIASSAGLVASVHSQPITLFQIDEIGHLLATMKNPSKAPHLYNIGSVLMQLYSSSDTIWKADAYADQKKNKVINQPHCVVYGTGVPDGFWDNMTAEAVKDGLLGRMLTFESRLGYVPMANHKNEPPPASIVERVREWLRFAPGGNLQDQNPQPTIADYDQPASDRLKEHLKLICDKRSGDDTTQAAVWSRSGEKTSKLALLFACSRNPPSSVLVTLDDVNRAIRIANFLTRQMLHKASQHVAENETESRSKRVLRIIASEAGGGIWASDLSRKTQWLKGKERADILADLQQAGLISAAKQESSGGRSGTIYQYGVKRNPDF